MTLLTYNSKYVVQSTTAVTSSSSTLADDTQASQTFTLSATQTVLAVYVANSDDAANEYHAGTQNAINIDGTNYAMMNDSPGNNSSCTRNVCVWVGSLESGSHTIKGKLASIVNGQSVIVSNRTLLIYVFNGDSFIYIDNTTSQNSSSTTYVNDSYATSTFTPSATCMALVFYAATNLDNTTEAAAGKKISIKIGSTNYTACEVSKAPYASTYSDSLATVYSISLAASQVTILGQYASANTGTVTLGRSVLGILLLDPAVTLDLVSSTTEVSSTSTALANDAQASITRNISGELLVFAAASKKYNTSSSVYGMGYGLNIDSSDVALSRSSLVTALNPESNFVAYAQTVNSASHTINGRLAVNYSTTATKVNTRILTALWFPAGGSTNALTSSMVSASSFTANNTAIEAQTSSILSASTFTANNAQNESQSSSISSASSFTANNKETEAVTSSILSASTFTANNAEQESLTSSISSISSITANNIETEALSSSISSQSSFTANNSQASINALTSSIVSTSTSTVNNTQIAAETSSIVSASTFTANNAQTVAQSTSIVSTSSFTANNTEAEAVTSSIISTSTFTANNIETAAESSSLISTSYFTANNTQGTAIPLTSSMLSASTFTANNEEAEELSSLILSVSSYNANNALIGRDFKYPLSYQVYQKVRVATVYQKQRIFILV